MLTKLCFWYLRNKYKNYCSIYYFNKNLEKYPKLFDPAPLTFIQYVDALAQISEEVK